MAFFGAGTLFLIAALCDDSVVLGRRSHGAIAGSGWWPVSRLGFRYATYRPGPACSGITLIACAAFIIVAVEAFRRTGTETSTRSPFGHRRLCVDGRVCAACRARPQHVRRTRRAEPAGRSNALTGVRIDRFRLRPGDDASCLNLYRPRNPRIIAAAEEFVRAGRFAFQTPARNRARSATIRGGCSNADRRRHRPVIGDANSLTYVLHLSNWG